VTFAYNGGPGGAAVWINLGAFGPKRVLTQDEGWPLPPPGKLVENPCTLLDITDLVFIDPAATGLSRIAEGVDRNEFHDLTGDVESVGDFIRLWTTRNGRWSSPKFLAGESYGTSRSAGLANYLQQRHGLYLNGIVMVSTVLNWLNKRFSVGHDLPFVFYLPTSTATAWYHKRLAPELLRADLAATLSDVERFALAEYAPALLKGDLLSEDDHRAVAEKLARYTGLSVDFVLRSNLRVPLGRFRKELLRDEDLTVGRLDTRFVGHEGDVVAEDPEFDASFEAVMTGYLALIADHISRDLEFETDLRHRGFAWNVHPWTFKGFENRFANMGEELRQAMVQNPSLKVLFATGYYDGATPYFDTIYTVSHLGLPPEIRRNVSIAFYDSGHMMYIRAADHAKLKRDVANFFEATLR